MNIVEKTNKELLKYLSELTEIKIIRKLLRKIDFECLNCGCIYTITRDIAKNKKKGCMVCTKVAASIKYRQGFMMFLEDGKIELLTELKTYREDITVKCNVCDRVWDTYPMKIKAPGSSGCSVCNGKKVDKRKENEFRKYLKKRDDMIMIGRFEKNYRPVKFKCLRCCHEWSACPEDIKKRDSGCPVCKQSRGEKLIEIYLKENRIEYIPQWINHNCIHKSLLRFDFYIPENNMVIEFQGEQHYRFNKFFHRTRERFEECKKRDKLKKQYCFDNQIRFIEISYKDVEKISDILNSCIVNKVSV